MDSVSRVAVVEDDPEISRMMTNYMTDHGFEVTAARNGRDLDRVLSGGKIDCVILDVGLPGEDGLSICRRLRGKSTVPIIMVTGRGTETDRIVGLELGADDYLPKPFNPRSLGCGPSCGAVRAGKCRRRRRRRCWCSRAGVWIWRAGSCSRQKGSRDR
jgi:two-component system OmpR family response regulator